MRNIVSSFFILLLLLFILWGISAWHIGKQTKLHLDSFFKTKNDATSELFNYHLQHSSPSLFGIHSKVLVELNENHDLSKLFGDSFPNLHLDIKIKNGPLFINSTGISFGRSLSKIQINHINEDKKPDNLIDKVILQLKTAEVIHSFDNLFLYEIPLAIDNNLINVKGKYDLKASDNTGNISSSNLMYESEDYIVSNKSFYLKYKISSNAVYLKAPEQELKYQHKLMSKPFETKFTYTGEIRQDKEYLNSKNQFFAKTISSDFPIENASLKLRVTDFDLIKFIEFYTQISDIKNLQNQMQWVLKDQAELPEGQDKLWLLQDQANRKFNNFKTDVLGNNESNPSQVISTYNYEQEYKGRKSNTKGVIKLSSNNVALDDLRQASLFSFYDVHSEVSLDNFLYNYLSSRLPIESQRFKLIYKQNKLLMQQ